MKCAATMLPYLLFFTLFLYMLLLLFLILFLLLNVHDDDDDYNKITTITNLHAYIEKRISNIIYIYIQSVCVCGVFACKNGIFKLTKFNYYSF